MAVAASSEQATTSVIRTAFRTGGEAVFILQILSCLRFECGFATAVFKLMDGINARMGKASIKLDGEGVDKSWAMKRGRVSAAYTTDFHALAAVHAY